MARANRKEDIVNNTTAHIRLNRGSFLLLWALELWMALGVALVLCLAMPIVIAMVQRLADMLPG